MTDKQRAAAQLLMAGMRPFAIADKLKVSHSMMRVRLAGLRRRLGVPVGRNNIALVVRLHARRKELGLHCSCDGKQAG